MIIKNINPGIFHIEVKIKEIIFGNTLIDKITGFDYYESTTLKLKCEDCTVIVFRKEMEQFRNFEIGDSFKALVHQYKPNIYNFKKLI